MTIDKQHTGEFIALMAFLMSLVALAIDAILPAFHAIGDSYLISDENSLQLLVGVLFLGLALGQLLYGPLSDTIGRKPAIYIGLGLFIAGSLLSAFAPSYDILLWGRFLQGFGVAAPRTISIALVRDQYSGREMAKIMSFIVSVFIIMPALAPALGAGVLIVGSWPVVFYTFATLAFAALVWLALRQPETHLREKRIPFSVASILRGCGQTLGNMRALGYTVVAGLAFACLVSYLNVAKLLYADVYNIDEMFPLYFAILALMIGAASIVNGKMVVKHGMRVMMDWALKAMIVSCVVFLAVIQISQGQPPFVLFMICMGAIFFFMGILFGNANAMAMEPMGHIAGVASSVIGAGTTFVSMSIGSLIGHFYDHNVLPMALGFFILSVTALVLMRLIEARAPALHS